MYPTNLQKIMLHISEKEKCNKKLLEEFKKSSNRTLTSELVTDGQICTYNNSFEGTCKVRHVLLFIM